MRFKRHLRLEYGLGALDIAPLIDVVFLLLIFFILTSSFAIQSGANVNLPKIITSEIVRESNMVITLGADNTFYLSGSAVSVEELKKELKKFKSNSGSVLIKADRKAYLGKVVEIWDLCREIGLEKVNVATNQEIE